MVEVCARLRPDPGGDLAIAAAKLALRTLARRHQARDRGDRRTRHGNRAT